MRGVEGRPQVAFQKFDNGLPGNNGVLGSGAGERRGSEQPFSVDRPVDLVGNIRAMVQQARAEWKVDAEFNPAWWLDERIESIANDAFALYRRSGYQQEPEEKVIFFNDLRTSWRLVSYEQQDGENGSGYTYLSGQADLHLNGHTSSITLPPLGVTLIDAMAEALDIPDHTPGQATFDLSLFNTYGQIEKIRINAPRLAPTKEEVKRAITPKPKNIVDASQ